jgi:hypothetical protein
LIGPLVVSIITRASPTFFFIAAPLAEGAAMAGLAATPIMIGASSDTADSADMALLSLDIYSSSGFSYCFKYLEGLL